MLIGTYRLVSRNKSRNQGNTKSSGYGPASAPAPRPRGTSLDSKNTSRNQGHGPASSSATASKASPTIQEGNEVEVKSKISPEARATLPPELVALLASPEFAAKCAKSFEQLDADKSGVLEPQEAVPPIIEMYDLETLIL